MRLINTALMIDKSGTSDAWSSIGDHWQCLSLQFLLCGFLVTTSCARDFPSGKELSRERHKSAPYLRLKNSKMTWKCQKTQYQTHKKSFETLLKNPNDRPGAPRGFLSIHYCIKKLNPLGRKKITERKSHNTEKTVRRDPLGFLNINSVAKHQKNWRGPFGDFFSKKSCTMAKNWMGTL